MENIEPHLIESFVEMNLFLQKSQVRYCLIGGIAAGFWGTPRFTRDMDFTVVSRSGKLDEIAALLKREGYKVKEKGPSQLQVVQKKDLNFQADFILAETDYQDWVVQRAISVPIFSVTVPICTAEDLIILKMIANRRQDLLDIENVLKNPHASLDQAYLIQWLKFWDLLENFSKEFPKALIGP